MAAKHPETIKFRGSTYQREQKLPEKIRFRGATYVIAIEVDEIKVPEVLKKNKKPKQMSAVQHIYDEALGAFSEGLNQAGEGYFPPTGIRKFVDKVVKLDHWDSSVRADAQNVKNNFNRGVAKGVANAEMALDYLNVLIDVASKYGLVDQNAYQQYLESERANLKDFRSIYEDPDSAEYYEGFRALFEGY